MGTQSNLRLKQIFGLLLKLIAISSKEQLHAVRYCLHNGVYIRLLI